MDGFTIKPKSTLTKAERNYFLNESIPTGQGNVSTCLVLCDQWFKTPKCVNPSNISERKAPHPHMWLLGTGDLFAKKYLNNTYRYRSIQHSYPGGWLKPPKRPFFDGWMAFNQVHHAIDGKASTNPRHQVQISVPPVSSACCSRLGSRTWYKMYRRMCIRRQLVTKASGLEKQNKPRMNQSLDLFSFLHSQGATGTLCAPKPPLLLPKPPPTRCKS